ncbi:mevalonate kinase, partial [candidate division KSB1 bacterium]
SAKAKKTLKFIKSSKMIINTSAYSRAGLIGNPSDGYYGKTISIIVKNFNAEITLYESPNINIIPNEMDISTFRSIDELISDVRKSGYYGGVRLIKATIKRFGEHCEKYGINLEKKNFTIEYKTNIPRLVGLAGSSAIITSTLRALMKFYNVEIPKPIQANLILSVESKELGITAGLQDRVQQVYEGIVYMDFNKKIMEKQGYGLYEPLDPNLLPPLYIAYKTKLSEVSSITHSNIKDRFNRGNKDVINAMKTFADIAEEAKKCILKKNHNKLGELINKNFDLRTKIFPINSANKEMVQCARNCGASAKFTGSGGSIIGIFKNEKMYNKLKNELKKIDAVIFKPKII